MKFDELDDKMRVFETAHDLCVLPGIYMVARLGGTKTRENGTNSVFILAVDS